MTTDVYGFHMTFPHYFLRVFDGQPALRSALYCDRSDC